MGINLLLKFLGPVTQKQHISSFRNQRIGIDLMPWLYKGCYSCNFQLSQDIESFRFLYYLLEMIEIMGYYKIKPIFVLDGRNLNMKASTNEKRVQRKLQDKEKGMKFLEEGNIQQARKYLSRSIFLTEKIVATTINVLHSKGIDFIVAPYEADSQIAKLKKLNLIDAAISQDSDLLVYGVNTIFKLNQNGECQYINIDKWKAQDVGSQYLKYFLSMDRMSRLNACVIAGTDYNSNIKGIGIKKAVKTIYNQVTISNVINKLKNDPALSSKIPQNYLEVAQKCKLIFLFATVYNPITQTLQYLNPDLLDYCPQQYSCEDLDILVGKPYPEYLQQQVYSGKTVAKTLEPRQIKRINIRNLLSVKVISYQQMLLHESEHRLRIQERQMIKGECLENSDNQQKQSSKQLDKIKGEQRLRKIIKLQEVMDSVAEMCNQEEMESEQVKNAEFQRKIEAINQQRQSNCSGSSSELQDSSQGQLQFDKEQLNPFVKKG